MMRFAIILFALIFVTGCASLGKNKAEHTLANHRLNLLQKHCLLNPSGELYKAPFPDDKIPPHLKKSLSEKPLKQMVGYTDEQGTHVLLFYAATTDPLKVADQCGIIMGEYDPTKYIGEWIHNKYPSDLNNYYGSVTKNKNEKLVFVESKDPTKDVLIFRIIDIPNITQRVILVSRFTPEMFLPIKQKIK